VRTSLGVTVAFFLARFLGGAGAPIRWKKTGRTLVTTAHPGTGCHQLAVSGETHAPIRRITWEGRGPGDDAIGHQTPDETVFAQEQPGRISVIEGHAEG
jgi:hypothetical protein